MQVHVYATLGLYKTLRLIFIPTGFTLIIWLNLKKKKNIYYIVAFPPRLKDYDIARGFFLGGGCFGDKLLYNNCSQMIWTSNMIWINFFIRKLVEMKILLKSVYKYSVPRQISLNQVNQFPFDFLKFVFSGILKISVLSKSTWPCWSINRI